MDHLAIHYAEYKKWVTSISHLSELLKFSLVFRSKNIFNYYCTLCRIHFYVLGMCAGCKCQAQNPQVVSLFLLEIFMSSYLSLLSELHSVETYDKDERYCAGNTILWLCAQACCSGFWRHTRLCCKKQTSIESWNIASSVNKSGRSSCHEKWGTVRFTRYDFILSAHVLQSMYRIMHAT